MTAARVSNIVAHTHVHKFLMQATEFLCHTALAGKHVDPSVTPSAGETTLMGLACGGDIGAVFVSDMQRAVVTQQRITG